MSRPSEPLLRWLRERVAQEGHTTASLAEALQRSRGDVRRLLTGEEPLLVDDLVRLGDLLHLDAASLGLPAAHEPSPTEELLDGKPEAAIWRNQPKALVQVAFDLGIDVLFVVNADALRGTWEGPDSVLDAHEGDGLPIRLDAAYHRFMDPVLDDDALRVTLSFDTLYRCVLPWSAFGRVVFFPLAPEAPAPPPSVRPTLRLVT